MHNLFLAVRAIGLVATLTTTHIRREQEIKERLGIPDYLEIVALTSLDYPRSRLTPTDRNPSAEVSTYYSWGISG